MLTILDNEKSINEDAMKLYPSPSPSPTVFPPTSPNDQESLIRPISKKRRKSIDPVKAIPKVVTKHDPKNDSCLSVCSSIRLDVYNLYTIDPNALVFSRIESKKSISASTQISNFNAIHSASTVLINQPVDDVVEEEVIYKPQSDRCKPLVTPVSTSDFDNSLYQNTQGAPHVLWKKGSSLTIPPTVPCYDLLTPEEIRTCSTLRVLPDQYLHIKQTILSAAEVRGPFKKRDAKSWFRIDVNKTAVLFDWFRSLGWIPSDEEWEKRVKI